MVLEDPVLPPCLPLAPLPDFTGQLALGGGEGSAEVPCASQSLGHWQAWLLPGSRELPRVTESLS